MSFLSVELGAIVELARIPRCVCLPQAGST